jgi:hypothetical protein
MDLAVLLETVIDAPKLRGRAALLREQGTQMAQQLVDVLRVETEAHATSTENLTEIVRRLRDAGFSIRADVDLPQVAAFRDQFVPAVAALADHLGTSHATLLPECGTTTGRGRHCSDRT